MSLASTSQYYVTVDSQFKDQEKYPLDTDFGVSFQTKNPNLNYPQGLPIDPSQPFPRVTIDKNFDSIGIQVKGGKITEYFIDSVTGDIIFSGVTVNETNYVFGTPFSLSGRDFLILYNDNILFSLLGSIYHSSPFICRVSSTYIPKWLIMIKQKPTKVNTTLDSTFKLISNSSLYFMFDYTLSSATYDGVTNRKKDPIYFEKYSYSSFDSAINTNIVNVKTLNYSFENYYIDYLAYNLNIDETNAVVGVFAFDVTGEPLQLNGHPWGYHQFAINTYYYGQIFSMLPSNTNGRNVITVDKGDNLYAGININPFDVDLQTNAIQTVTPYYNSELSNVKKPIFYSISTTQNIKSENLGSITVSPTQTDNVLVYYLGCSSTDEYQNTGANEVGLLKLNITSPSFTNVDRGLEVNLLSDNPISVGTFINKNSVLPVTLVGNSNDVQGFYPAPYNTGTIYNISNYQYYPTPSPITQGNGIMTLDKQFGYTGTMNNISTLNLTGTNVSKEYINFITVRDIERFNIYSYMYTYTGAGNSSLDLVATSELGPVYDYDYSTNNSKIANWNEGSISYVAYVLRGDINNGTYNTVFIRTINSSSGSLDTPSSNNTINVKKGLITDFQAFTINTKVFLILVSNNVTYVFKRDYSVSSTWTTLTIPNNAHYIIPKIKAVGTTYRIYLVGSNLSLNTSNVYVIPYDNTTYYYQLGSEYRFASGKNAVVSLTDNNIVSFGKVTGADSTFNFPKGFTFQDKIIDSQHIYNNNSYVSILPTEYLTNKKIVSSKTLTVNGTTYLFTLRYEDFGVTNIDIFYMDSFTPIFITNFQYTRTSSGDPQNPDFRVYYVSNGTNDIDGVPYGQDSSSNIGAFIILVSPDKASLTDGVKLISYDINSSTALTFSREDLIDSGSTVYNSWIYSYNGVYYLINNVTDLSSSSSTLNIYSIDYKYRYSFLSTQTLPSGTIYIKAGEIYYDYIDVNTGQKGPVLICYYTTTTSGYGYCGILSIYPFVIGILQSNILPSPVVGLSQPTYISIDRNKRTNDYGIIAISWAYYTYLLKLQDSGTFTLSDEVIGGNYNGNYQSVSVVWNPVLNRLYTTLYSQTNSNVVLVYDVTNAGSTTDIITLTAQINLKDVLEYNNYVSNNSPYNLYSGLCNQNIILFTNYLAYKNQGPAAGAGVSFPTFPTLITYDLSNPIFANIYQTPTKISNNTTIYGNGNCCLVKLQNDGQTLWNMSLGDSGNYSYASSIYDSQYVNVNSISLDSTELNLYSSINWKTKLSVIDYSSSIPSQNITNPFNSYSAQNSSLLKVRGDIGTSTFLIPIVGGNDTLPIGCNPIATTAFSLGLSAKSSITYIYRNQPAGTLTNPSVIQNVVNTLSLENSHVIAIDTSGNLLWSSSIQSTTPTTSIPASYLYTYGGDSFLVCKSNENCYITDSSKIKKQNIIQFPETVSQDYILITRFDSSGLYKESNTIETPADISITPQYLFSNGTTFSLSANNYQRNLDFADLWIRNKDGTIGSIESLPEENLYFTRTTYSTPGIYIYNTPTGCIGSVVKLWGAGGDAGLFYLNAGPTPTPGGQGGGGAFAKTFIDPSYNKFAIKVGASSMGGQTRGSLIDAYDSSGFTGTGIGGRGGEASWVAVDSINPTGPIEGNFVFYAIAGGGGGGGYIYLNAGGPGGNNPSVNIGSMGNYGQNGIGGFPNPTPSADLDSKGVNCSLKIQNTSPFFYTLTGSFGKGGTGANGCGGGGDGFGGGAGGNYAGILLTDYNGGAGGGVYGYTTILSDSFVPANYSDIDYDTANYVGEGGCDIHFTGGNGYAVVYSFFYSSTGYIKGQPPAGTGINPTYIDGTVINYKYNPSYIDPNGTTYSKLTCYTSSGSTGSEFLPYHTIAPFYFSSGSTGTDLIGKYIYIKGDPSDTILNNNFSIRESSYNSSTNEYNIVLNSKVDTSQIVRQFQEVNDNNFTNYFYTSNIAQSLTTAILPFGGPTGSVISVPNTYTFDTTKKYYIITPTNKVTNITNISLINSRYYLTVDTPSNLLGNTYITITPFNNSALYTLQFYPGSLATPLYYKVSLQRLTIPNRRIRNSLYTGVRELSDFPYIFLEIYNTSDDDTYDNQIVNTFYSNDPNKDGRAIFTIPITSAGGQSNYLFLSSAGTPKVKFTPGYYNIRFRLVDPYGNIIEFDNTPYKTSDAAFVGGVVDPRLMNVIVDVIFSPV
jgi:hypothetical protein